MSDITERLREIRDRDCYDAADEIERLRAELAAAQEKTSVSLTVGGGLEVYGTMDAIHRVQRYILLDSRHPVESADVRRSLARALKAAEAERDALRAENKALDKLAQTFVKAMKVTDDEHDALRALLREARNFMPFYTEELRARIDAALNKGARDD